ncbi:MAG: hypothetical protein KDB14_19545 [Planctomycetales bacterium]|nr:hypothetical protein [Planctomycetales bacterium]
MTRKTGILLALGVFGVCVGLWWIGSLRHEAQDQRKLRFAEQLVNVGRAEEAIAVVDSQRLRCGDSQRQRRWLDVRVRALEHVGDALRLGQVYYDDPSALDGHEEASLLAARALILKNDVDNFQRLRGQWQGREDQPHAWMILEADALLRRGRRAQALALLTENQLSEHWDASRHVRLALLHASDPIAAWEHLEQAIDSEPMAAVPRLFRAQLLEAAGRLDEARLEYIAARLAQPENGAFCDQLAEYYRRRGAYQQMLDTWLDARGEARADFMDLKVEFWSRVAVPVATQRRRSPAHGPLEGIVQLLQTLPEECYWDDRLITDYQGAYTADRRPEIRWLRLLELLRCGDEAAAIQLLRQGDAVPWEQAPRRTLLMVLNLRSSGELDRSGELRTDVPVDSASHPLIDALNSAHAANEELSAELRQLLSGPHGIAMVLLANGWMRAAIQLDDPSALPANAPVWAGYGMTQARRAVEGEPAALEYALRQPASGELQLLIAELSMHANESEALRLLEQSAALPGALGERAHFLATTWLLEHERFQQTLDWLERFPDYRDSQRGQETRARLALMQHDPDTAERIYRSLRDQSIEAKAFLAKAAAYDERWDDARQLTLELLKAFPADQALLRSLRQIESHLGEPSGTQPTSRPAPGPADTDSTRNDSTTSTRSAITAPVAVTLGAR